MPHSRKSSVSDDTKIVNVSTVPKRSPFRYPGGKTWLVPFLRSWMARGAKPALFVDIFAGGGIVPLTIAAENLADHVMMVELDPSIAAVWQVILSADHRRLCQKISSFDMTRENAAAALGKEPKCTLDVAFQTVLKNRVNRGGIMAPGSAMIGQGENGKGVKSRWYPETLCTRIQEIHALRHKISFHECDGIQVLKTLAHVENACFFVDPPYTAGGKKAGNRLYAHHELNHVELFNTLACCRGRFLATYDDAAEVRQWSRTFHFQIEEIPMKNTHHEETYELAISKRA